MIQATAPAGIAAAQRGMAERPDVSAWLSQIDVPTLVLVGAEDAITPRDEMHAISQTIAGSQFVEIADAGHMAPMEAAAEVNAAIKGFLSSLG